MGRKKKINKDFLTEAEIDTIKTYDEVIRNKNLELENVELKKRIVELQYELNITKIGNSKAILTKDIKERSSCHKDSMKLMASSRGIDGKWSFNPDNGEIIKED